MVIFHSYVKLPEGTQHQLPRFRSSQASIEPRQRLHRGAAPGCVGRSAGSAHAAVAGAILQRRPFLGGRRRASRGGETRRNGMADATGAVGHGDFVWFYVILFQAFKVKTLKNIQKRWHVILRSWDYWIMQSTGCHPRPDAKLID